MIGASETVARGLGLAFYGGGLALAALGAVRGSRAGRAHATGLAARIGAIPAYLLTAVPYFAVCAMLWRPLPGDPSAAVRWACLAIAVPLGAAGLGLYALAHAALGRSYDVSGGLGTVVHNGAPLVTRGVYARVRHPMYLGIACGALAGLLLYRTWTFVFVLASLVAIARKARMEDRLLAEAYGEAFASYRDGVPAWAPRLRRRSRPAAAPSAPAASR